MHQIASALDEPSEFGMVDENQSSESQAFSSSQPSFAQRPAAFRENHVFQPNDGAWAILPHNGRLRPMSGRIVQCYRNENGIIIYVLRSVLPGVAEFHFPRWLLFHYQEDAVFVRDNVYSDEDRNQIMQFNDPRDSTFAEGLEFELVEDYVRRWRDDDIPETQLAHNTQVAPIALGAPRHVLKERTPPASDDDETADSSPDESCTPSKNRSDANPRMSIVSDPPAPSAMQYTKKTIKSMPTQQSTSKQVPLPSKDPPSPPDDASSGSSCGPQIVVPPYANYNPNFRRDFDEVLDDFESNVMLRRMFENAVENVTLFALSRLPRNYITYEELYYIIRRGK